MAEVTLEEVTKVFGEDVVAVDKMNLDIPDGGFVVFVGPSGCGSPRPCVCSPASRTLLPAARSL